MKAMITLLKGCLGTLLLVLSLKAFSFENLVYTWRGFPNQLVQGRTAIEALKAHAAKIDILSSQAYHVTETGYVYGEMNPEMIALAKKAKIHLMPLVGNTNFDRKRTHNFLTKPAAQKRAIDALLALCKKHQFYGLQIDFEGMSYLDREAYTHFYQEVAEVLHRNGFKVSIAIIPMLTAGPMDTAYLKGKFRGWAGVYDYKALGESSDFMTLMAYDQHGGDTPPGPMAGYRWDEAIVRYALQYIPADKLSLGIPWHSGYWFMGKHLHIVGKDLSYAEAKDLMTKNKIKLHWDEEDKIHYARFENRFLDEHLFLEDVASFKAKLALVKKYGLRGISNWCLGEEDPKIWALLPKRS